MSTNQNISLALGVIAFQISTNNSIFVKYHLIQIPAKVWLLGQVVSEKKIQCEKFTDDDNSKRQRKQSDDNSQHDPWGQVSLKDVIIGQVRRSIILQENTLQL